MGKSLFIVLAVCLMMSGTHGVSKSMSCSTVNGKMICNEESSQGDTAIASSSSYSSPGGESMNTYAGTGNPTGNWQSSGQRVVNGNGPSPSNDYFEFDKTELQEDPGGFDVPNEEVCSYSSSGSAEDFGTHAGPMPTVGGFGFVSAGNFFPPGFPFSSVPGIANTPQDSSEPKGGSPDNNNFGSQGATGEFAGGPTLGGFSYTYSSSGSVPNFGTNVGPAPTIGGFAGGFATAGNTFSPGFPFNFVPGYGNTPQVSSRPNGGGFSGGGFPGGFGPGRFGPGGFGPGAYAGAGAGAFAGGFDPMAFVFRRQ